MNSEILNERLSLAKQRVEEIVNACSLEGALKEYFTTTASFICDALHVTNMDFDQMSLEDFSKLNHYLYSDILPENYEKSFANPTFACTRLGEYGPYLCFVYSQLRGIIPFVFELKKSSRKLTDIVILMELFLEIHSSFHYANLEKETVTAESIKDVIYWYLSDYLDVTLLERVHEQLDSSLSFARDIIMDSDLNDLTYLYHFGEYISENEIKIAKYLNSLPEETIQSMADTFTEGYRIGFINTGKDLSIKDTVNIRYSLGFERIVRYSINNFKKMGLSSIIYRSNTHAATGNTLSRVGYYGAIPNRQYDYDHKEDMALFLDKAFRDRKLDVLKESYESYKELAYKHAGPAVMEVFGQLPFSPAENKNAPAYDKKQQKLTVEYASRAGAITNQYIKGEERSFTIIAYPIPEIGDAFEEIFNETVKINTLDYNTYKNIQQKIIDVMDKAVMARIKGKGNNKTDLSVKLRTLSDPATQTQFENCVADVNIPVGEVFTSPVLEGTSGILHVSEVYLNDLKFTDLSVEFADGYVKDYSCKNFSGDKGYERGRKYFKDNVLMNHETLPLGEFAIGTNTTAYAMAKKYNIFDRLPILIAEKTGPHFAVGDTCYSHAEEIKVYNPDGKEIIAKDNSCSILRNESFEKAYFNCHTDITIPYDELGLLSVIFEDGTETAIIENGRFTLPGCEELNLPLNA